ncbi:hypothetical protein LJC23_01080 [Desulfovibrio sp. OttesenSCG-928-I05]|nr:hypothetical protein [Desulfovibrio sp. OttesenSCG-928-I05]
MDIRFVKMSPTQNMTILVENPVPRELHHQVASALMGYDNVFAEQVGYIEPAADPRAWGRLQMMGGEFCGNATMCLAALLVMDKAAAPSGRPGEAGTGGTIEVPLEVSGADGLVSVDVTLQATGARCSLEMPAPESVESHTLTLDGHDYHADAVTFAGITHLIVDKDTVPGDKTAFAESTAAAWQQRYNAEAVGVMLYDKESNAITPLVHVASTQSYVWERGCGSGTAAVGAWLATKAAGTVTADIAQPGGVISVRGEFADGRVRKVVISGDVKLVARGTAYV